MVQVTHLGGRSALVDACCLRRNVEGQKCAVLVASFAMMSSLSGLAEQK
jgi:hypothetical protein